MDRHYQYQIPKTLRQVTLWVHPEGRVLGSLFLNFYTKNGPGMEDPCVVLNEAAPFLVLQRSEPDELRFYNKKALIRVEYQEEEVLGEENVETLYCQLSLMDGSLIEGVVRYPLPPGHARLYDYLNLNQEQFVKLHLDNDGICLVNKAYIVYVSQLAPPLGAEPWGLLDVVESGETYA